MVPSALKELQCLRTRPRGGAVSKGNMLASRGSLITMAEGVHEKENSSLTFSSRRGQANRRRHLFDDKISPDNRDLSTLIKQRNPFRPR